MTTTSAALRNATDFEARPGLTACRFCGSDGLESVVDLGKTPLCETFLTARECTLPEVFYPLHAVVCSQCFLMQVGEFVPPEQIFSADYPYYSSYSSTWVAHARAYVDSMVAQLSLGKDSLVVELGSNDGYLLQHFQPHGVPVLGIEPAAGVAEAARERGVPTEIAFFAPAQAEHLRSQDRGADLIIANNVLAQVPDLNGFVAAISTLLMPGGVITIEVPHVLRLLEGLQFDTIYHEHFSYFSLYTLERIFASHGLTVFHVEELPTHGGSLRLFGAHAEAGRRPSKALTQVRGDEEKAGITNVVRYQAFGDQVRSLKRALLGFLIAAYDRGQTVAGYGAPGKANTLLNYCGIGPDLLSFTTDLNPRKQGRFTPGTHIPIHSPQAIDDVQPDFVMILPWNLRTEITAQLAHIRQWGGRFVLPLPDVIVD